MSDLYNKELLQQTLDALEAGIPPEEILARYPEDAATIQPILTITSKLSQLARKPAPGSQEASQEVFLAHAKAISQVGHRPRRRLTWWRRLAAGLALFVVIFVGMLSLFEQSASALPGDPLYGLKRAQENIQLTLTQDEEVVEALQDQFEHERYSEIERMLELGREGKVTCTGTVESIAGNIWIIYGQKILVNENTIIEGEAQVGSEVTVSAVIRGQNIIANRIEILSLGDNNDGTPPVTETPSASPTNQPSPTLAATPLPTSTSAPTITVTPDDDEEDDEEIESGEEIEDEDELTETPGPDSTEEADDDDHDDDDNSGSGSGDDDHDNDDDDDDDNSGSGSGDDDHDNDDHDDDDNSGSGSGDDDHDDDDRDDRDDDED